MSPSQCFLDARKLTSFQDEDILPVTYPYVTAAVLSLTVMAHWILRESHFGELRPMVCSRLSEMDEKTYERWVNPITAMLTVVVVSPILLVVSWGVYAMSWSSCPLVPGMLTVGMALFVTAYIWVAREIHWQWRRDPQTVILSWSSVSLLAALTVCAAVSVNTWSTSEASMITMSASLATVWSAVFVSVRSDSIWIFDIERMTLARRQRKGMILVGSLLCVDAVILLAYAVAFSATSTSSGRVASSDWIDMIFLLITDATIISNAHVLQLTSGSYAFIRLRVLLALAFVNRVVIVWLNYEDNANAILLIEPVLYLTCGTTLGVSSATYRFPLRAFDAVDKASEEAMRDKHKENALFRSRGSISTSGGSPSTDPRDSSGLQSGALGVSSAESPPVSGMRTSRDELESALVRIAHRVRGWTANRLRLLTAMTMFHVVTAVTFQILGSSTSMHNPKTVDVGLLGETQVLGFQIAMFMYVLMITAWGYIYCTLGQHFQLKVEIQILRIRGFTRLVPMSLKGVSPHLVDKRVADPIWERVDALEKMPKSNRVQLADLKSAQHRAMKWLLGACGVAGVCVSAFLVIFIGDYHNGDNREDAWLGWTNTVNAMNFIVALCWMPSIVLHLLVYRLSQSFGYDKALILPNWMLRLHGASKSAHVHAEELLSHELVVRLVNINYLLMVSLLVLCVLFTGDIVAPFGYVVLSNCWFESQLQYHRAQAMRRSRRIITWRSLMARVVWAGFFNLVYILQPHWSYCTITDSECSGDYGIERGNLDPRLFAVSMLWFFIEQVQLGRLRRQVDDFHKNTVLRWNRPLMCASLYLAIAAQVSCNTSSLLVIFVPPLVLIGYTGALSFLVKSLAQWARSVSIAGCHHVGGLEDVRAVSRKFQIFCVGGVVLSLSMGGALFWVYLDDYLNLNLDSALIVYLGVTATLVAIILLFIFTSPQPAFSLITKRFLPRWSFSRIEFNKPDSTIERLSSASTADDEENKLRPADSALRPTDSANLRPSDPSRTINTRVELDNWYGLTQYFLAFTIVTTGFVLLVCHLPHDASQEYVEQMSFIGLLCVSLGELFVFVIHPYEVCNMIMKSGTTVGYVTDQMMYECNTIAIRAELDLANEFFSCNGGHAHEIKYPSCLALAQAIIDLRTQLSIADLPIREARTLAEDLHHRLSLYRRYTNKEVRFAAHYQLRVLAVATTAEAISSGAVMALTRQGRLEECRHQHRDDELRTAESHDLCRMFKDQEAVEMIEHVEQAKVLSRVVIGKVPCHESHSIEHSDHSPGRARRGSVFTEQAPFSALQEEEGVDRVMAAIQTFVNCVDQRLKFSLEVLWVDFCEQCSKYGKSKIRILPENDLNAIFGTEAGCVNRLRRVASDFASSLEYVHCATDAPVSFVAACVIEHIKGAHFPEYMETLALRQARIRKCERSLGFDMFIQEQQKAVSRRTGSDCNLLKLTHAPLEFVAGMPELLEDIVKALRKLEDADTRFELDLKQMNRAIRVATEIKQAGDKCADSTQKLQEASAKVDQLVLNEKQHSLLLTALQLVHRGSVSVQYTLQDDGNQRTEGNMYLFDTALVCTVQVSFEVELAAAVDRSFSSHTVQQEVPVFCCAASMVRVYEIEDAQGDFLQLTDRSKKTESLFVSTASVVEMSHWLSALGAGAPELMARSSSLALSTSDHTAIELNGLDAKLDSECLFGASPEDRCYSPDASVSPRSTASFKCPPGSTPHNPLPSMQPALDIDDLDWMDNEPSPKSSNGRGSPQRARWKNQLDMRSPRRFGAQSNLSRKFTGSGDWTEGSYALTRTASQEPSHDPDEDESCPCPG
eukprot:TRINITY_DN11534_c0_g1_i3.p1 TRINITY_DN11534_c0_g1~~TRINITY_DN11534_c0_g1_i3.p1  ORF type:complete len:1813 (+),score=335.21 TRINITY_DN11534_c0_g1_i3:66-5504(+)